MHSPSKKRASPTGSRTRRKIVLLVIAATVLVTLVMLTRTGGGDFSSARGWQPLPDSAPQLRGTAADGDADAAAGAAATGGEDGGAAGAGVRGWGIEGEVFLTTDAAAAALVDATARRPHGPTQYDKQWADIRAQRSWTPLVGSRGCAVPSHDVRMAVWSVEVGSDVGSVIPISQPFFG